MSASPEEQEAQIETLKSATGAPDIVTRLLDYAARGVEDPESLSMKEIEDLSYAVLVHYRIKEVTGK